MRSTMRLLGLLRVMKLLLPRDEAQMARDVCRFTHFSHAPSPVGWGGAFATDQEPGREARRPGARVMAEWEVCVARLSTAAAHPEGGRALVAKAPPRPAGRLSRRKYYFRAFESETIFASSSPLL